MMYHEKDGTHINREQLEEKFKDIFQKEDWILDGNYQKTLEMRLKQCDTVFLLDFPTKVCIEGAESRIGKKRDDLPWIEEKLDEEFKQNIVKQDYFLHGKWFIKTVYSKNVSNEILDK